MFPAISRMHTEHAELDEERDEVDAVEEMTRISRGKYTFLIKLPLLISVSGEAPTPIWKKFQGIKPQTRNSAKLESPLGSPVGGSTFRKTPKTSQ